MPKDAPDLEELIAMLRAAYKARALRVENDEAELKVEFSLGRADVPDSLDLSQVIRR